MWTPPYLVSDIRCWDNSYYSHFSLMWFTSVFFDIRLIKDMWEIFHKTDLLQRSSLIYNTSARHKRHECDTSDTSATPTTWARHEWKNLILITALVKTYFHTLIFTYIYLLIIFTKNCLLEMPRFHAKMRLKSASQKLNFLIAKAMSKRCTLDCSSIKSVLCENSNIRFSITIES